MTKQELFDTVWNHFIVNKGLPSTKKVSSGQSCCVYRGDEGRKCAFGVLLPDEWYKPAYEGYNCKSVIKDLAVIQHIKHPLLDSFQQNAYLLLNMQNVHDDAALYAERTENQYDFHAGMEEGLKTIASNFYLQIPK